MEMGQPQDPVMEDTTTSPTTTKLELTVDEAIEKHVGSLGLSQMLHVFLISLAWVFEAQTTLVTIFSDAQPSAWRCKHDLHHQNISSSCTSFAASSNGVGSVCGLEPGAWEWVGGHKSSVIAEFGLICDRKFLAAVPASLFFLGSLLGSAAYGHLADGWLGRKRTVLVSCIFTALTAYLTSLSPNIWVYAFLRLTSGFFRSGLGSCIVLATEVVGRKWRGQVGQYGFFLFTAGFLSLPFMAYPTRKNWRNLYRIIAALPLAYTIFLIPFVSESPRWLLVRGRGEEALDVLRHFARRNGRRLPENLSLLNPSSAKEMAEESLWRTKWAAKRMIIIMVSGFGIGFVYYGIQLNVENLDFNLYFTVGVNALMEIPAVLLGSIMLALMNRRLVFSLSAYIAGASCLFCILFSHRKKTADGSKLKSGGSWPQLLTEGVGFMAISIAFDVMYIYCVELFPTNVRNFAMAMLRQALMLGASVAPMLVAVGRMSPALSFLVFGVLSIFSGILTIWLPETRNAPLYDTLKEQEEEEGKASRGSELELGN